MAEVLTSSVPPIQKRITTNSTNFDIFAETDIAAELLAKWGWTTTTIANSNIRMKISIFPDTSATVIINGYEQDAPDFYSTSGFVDVKTLLIKETGVSALVIIQIV